MIDTNAYLGFAVDFKTHAALIGEKVELLYDFCILDSSRSTPDPRERAVRLFLNKYTTEEQMTRALHDVIFGIKTLEQLLFGGTR